MTGSPSISCFNSRKKKSLSSGQLRIAFNNKQLDDTIIESYVFFALKLRESSYTRTQLSNITREINKLTPMPAMILFQHGQTVTLAVINRRLHKRDESKDVLEKVTLIKDIDSHDPHPAHIKILFDLSRNELFRVHGFSNFVELHRAWEKTLDIQELNKQFYRELSNWYFWAVDNVTFPEDAGERRRYPQRYQYHPFNYTVNLCLVHQGEKISPGYFLQSERDRKNSY